MEDSRILDLFWARDEEAVSAVSAKYGPYCRTIARNLLGNAEDTEECLNDTWHQAWQRIPPQRPQHLKPWLGKVVRGIAINRWNRNHAEKRGSGLDLLLSELEDCIPGGAEPEKAVEDAELGAAISRWLRTLPQEDRVLFVRRYWHGVALNTLADEAGIPSNKLAQRMFRLRRSLRTALEKEDIRI